MRRRILVPRAVIAAALMAVALMVTPIAAAHHGPPYADGDDHDFGEMVDYWLVFPVDDTDAAYTYFYDTFYSPRAGGTIHHAQDIMAPKMTPIVASNSGTIKYVNWSRSDDPPTDRCCTLVIDHDDGWESWYIHMNNDTPGTDDGQGWGIAPGILPGVHVNAGQLVGWVGDSGNAENTGPHLHYELKDPEGTLVNPYQALIAARENGPIPRCDKYPVTLFALAGVPLFGTDGDDVILGSEGDDEIYAGDGDDIVCGLGGRDLIDGGPGNDRLFGGEQGDWLYGRRGADILDPGSGGDRLYGGKGRDILISEFGENRLRGGGGIDWADYSGLGTGVTVDLSLGRARTVDTLGSIENVLGSPYDDIIAGSDGREKIKGGPGDDQISGGGGDDILYGGPDDDMLDGGEGDDDIEGGPGIDTADGGEGYDWCEVEVASNCE